MKKSIFFSLLIAFMAALFSQKTSAQIGGIDAFNIDLCIIGGETINDYPLLDYVEGEDAASVVTIINQPDGFEITLNPDNTIKVIPTTAFVGMLSSATYSVCDSIGFCDMATINIIYAEIESIDLPQPVVIGVATLTTIATQICTQNIGWVLQNNCIPNLFTVCLTHNENLGTLEYINNECVNYVSNGVAGTDTIRIVGCGDAPPPTFYTCNGPVSMSNCNETWIIVEINSTSTTNTFTEVHDLTCAEVGFISGLGYPIWNVPTIVDDAEHGLAQIMEGDAFHALQYTPFPGFSGSDTVIVACAHATQITCDTGIYVFNVTCDLSMYLQLEKSAICGIASNLGDYVGSWGFAPQIMAQPAHGVAFVEGFTVYYTPNAGYVGTDTLYVSNVSGGPADESINGIFIIEVDCDNAIPSIAHLLGLKAVYTPNGRAAIVTLQNAIFENLTLFDLNGKMIQKQYSFENPQRAEVNFEGLPAGLYLLRAQSNKGIEVIKLLIK